MSLKFMEHYTPEDCRSNPDDLYVFGDNLHRTGKAGQAFIRDEPNAVGIATKHGPSMHDSAFLRDSDYDNWLIMNDDAWSRIEAHLKYNGGTVVFPSFGLGTGLVQLETRAPKIWAELQAWMDRWKAEYGE